LTQQFCIIGDIAGQFKTLMALLEKMPKANIISVGDLVDRGPDSDKVVKYFMETPNTEALMGNHEHLMLDYCIGGRFYSHGLWQYNGGRATLNSYGGAVPREVTDWMSTLKKFKEIEIGDKRFFVSHAFLYKTGKAKSLQYNPNDFENSILWNRWEPERVKQYDLQIAGHNSQWGLRRFSDEKGEYAISIDTSASKVLTGIHLPSLNIFQQEYVL
jgi:hypothetical protein